MSCYLNATILRLWYFWRLCLQVFQLTAFVVRRPVDMPRKISVCLTGVQVARDEVDVAITCVQDFVRGPLFTQRNFSESEISILTKAVFSTPTICEGSAFDPWGSIGVFAGSAI